MWGIPVEVLVGIIGLIGVIFTAVFSEKRASKKALALVKKQEKLIYHPIFAQLDSLEMWCKTRYCQSDLGRTTLSREMMVHKIRVWRPLLKGIAQEFDDCFDNCHGGKLPQCTKVYNRFCAVLNEGLEKYTLWHKAPVVHSIDGGREYTQSDKNTMSLYVQKFQEWHSPREEMVSVMTREIGESMLYDNCVERAWDILTVFQAAFIGMKPDAEKTLKSLNGELTGKKILGIVIGDHK